MTLCSTCPLAVRCPFLTAARLAQIHFGESGRLVSFSVDRCSVREQLAKTTGGFEPGSSVEVFYLDAWRAGTIAQPALDGYVTILVDMGDTRSADVMIELATEADKIRPL